MKIVNMDINLLQTVTINDLFNTWIKERNKDDSLALISYGSYIPDSAEDILNIENLEYIDSVGVDKDNNIYLAKTSYLINLYQNGIFIRKYIGGISNFKDLMQDIIYLVDDYCSRKNKIFVKDNKGHILSIKEIIEDVENNRIVFLTE